MKSWRANFHHKHPVSQSGTLRNQPIFGQVILEWIGLLITGTGVLGVMWRKRNNYLENNYEIFDGLIIITSLTCTLFTYYDILS